MKMTNPKVDAYLGRAKKWREEMEKLRAIALECQLTEELKWGKPVYTFEGKNVLIIWGFKEHAALGFCKGALLKDPRHLLLKPGENSQSMRKIQFRYLSEIIDLEATLKAYIREAAEVEKAGLEVTYKKTSDFVIPDELQETFRESPAFKKAFAALTPGRQRGYLLHFSAAKQSQTRTARIEKCLPQILEGKGLGDDYARSQKRR